MICSRIYTMVVEEETDCADWAQMVWVSSGEFGNGTSSATGDSGSMSASGISPGNSSGGSLDGNMVFTFVENCDCVLTVDVTGFASAGIDIFVNQDGNPVLVTGINMAFPTTHYVFPFTLVAGVASAINVHFDYLASGGDPNPPPVPAGSLSATFVLDS